MTDEEKSAAARQIQADRDLGDYQRAIENIAWLSAPSPTWACGTPVTRSDIYHFLELNRRNAERLEPKVSAQFPSLNYPHLLKGIDDEDITEVHRIQTGDFHDWLEGTQQERQMG